MLLRSGRQLGSPNRCGGGCSFSEAGGRLRLHKRKSLVKGEAASPRRVRGKSPEFPVSAQDGTNNRDDESSDEASIAALATELFPHLPPEVAADGWVKFVSNAKLCIKHYNNENQVNFVYKHSNDSGFALVEEPDSGPYYHLNFLAQDHDGNTKLFFGEIKLNLHAKDNEVSCCSPVSQSYTCGKSIRTVEEGLKHGFPEWEVTGEKDLKHCYSCRSLMRHPKEASYIGGHIANSMQYNMFL